jgi:L-fucose isomerase-like protein
MKINYIELKSPITPVNRDHVRQFLTGIEEKGKFQLEKCSLSDYKEADFCLIYIMTGGTEGIFLENFEILSSKPCYLLTSGESNSLAASMEILSFLKNRGYRGEILHGDFERIADRINSLYRTEKTLNKINGMKVGTIGGSSDWLIDSEPDEEAYKNILGIEIIHISMEELLEEIRHGGYKANEWTEKLLSLGYDKNEMTKSLNVYGAVQRIVEKYRLSAVTVRCFDLLSTVHTTGCLALAILNAEGIYAGCEGDLPSLISMIILGEISQNPVFMCNLNQINTKNNELIFAY